MLKLHPTSKFKKDLKRIKKRGYDISKLDDVIIMLLHNQTLPETYLDHPLSGNYIGFRECHICPDWLLIYAVDNNRLILTASRTGSHTDVF